MKFNQQTGFNLIEMMIVIVIVGILAAIAFPSYERYILKSNRSDGQSHLLEAASRMERYYYANSAYTTDLTKIGYGQATDVASSEGHYQLKVVAATVSCPITTCYKLQATAINRQSSDGDLTVDSLGQKLPEDKW